jgi:CDP-glycerol glycerophosphotransferase (TagB/SpsB family)
MDVYSLPIKNSQWKHKNKTKIVYAPHHSFEDNSLRWATFQWNGKYILELAKKYEETCEFIFKPHPRFSYSVVEAGIMTKKEVDEYYEDWKKIGNIYSEGDYFDIFRTSNMMITDCGSFLTEYLPTGNPVIHLLNSGKESKYRSVLHEYSSQHYYKVYDLDKLEEVFDMLINQGVDPLKSAREKDAAEFSFDSANNIYNFIKELVK